MPNVLDLDVPKRIQILTILEKHCKKNFFQINYWKTKHEILSILGNNGRAKDILNQFIDEKIIQYGSDGYFLNKKLVKSLLLKSYYITCAKSFGIDFFT